MTRKERIMYDALKRVTENAVSMSYIEKDTTCFVAFEEVENMPPETCGTCGNYNISIERCLGLEDEGRVIYVPISFGCNRWESI